MEQQIPCGSLRRIAVPLLSTTRSPKPLKPHLPQVTKISRLLLLHTEEAMDELDAIQAKKGGLGQREQWVRYPPISFTHHLLKIQTGHVSIGFGGLQM